MAIESGTATRTVAYSGLNRFQSQSDNSRRETSCPGLDHLTDIIALNPESAAVALDTNRPVAINVQGLFVDGNLSCHGLYKPEIGR
jgi:hypothetical protein